LESQRGSCGSDLKVLRIDKLYMFPGGSLTVVYASVH
jgi:hypothetical protein